MVIAANVTSSEADRLEAFRRLKEIFIRSKCDDLSAVLLEHLPFLQTLQAESGSPFLRSALKLFRRRIKEHGTGQLIEIPTFLLDCITGDDGYSQSLVLDFLFHLVRSKFEIYPNVMEALPGLLLSFPCEVLRLLNAAAANMDYDGAVLDQVWQAGQNIDLPDVLVEMIVLSLRLFAIWRFEGGDGPEPPYFDFAVSAFARLPDPDLFGFLLSAFDDFPVVPLDERLLALIFDSATRDEIESVRDLLLRFQPRDELVDKWCSMVDSLPLSGESLLAREIIEPFVTDAGRRGAWVQQAAEALRTPLWLDGLLCLVAFDCLCPQFFAFALDKAQQDFSLVVSVLHSFLMGQFPRQVPWFQFLWMCYGGARPSAEAPLQGDALFYHLIDILVAFVENDPGDNVCGPYEHALDDVLVSWIRGELYYVDGSLLAALLGKVESGRGVMAVIEHIHRITEQIMAQECMLQQALDGVCAIMKVLVVKYSCPSPPIFFGALATLMQGVANDKSTAAASFSYLLLACKKAFPADMGQIWPDCVKVMRERFSERAEQEVTLTAIARVILEIGLDEFDDVSLAEFMENGKRIFARHPDFFRDPDPTRKPNPLNQLMSVLLRKFSDAPPHGV